MTNPNATRSWCSRCNGWRLFPKGSCLTCGRGLYERGTSEPTPTQDAPPVAETRDLFGPTVQETPYPHNGRETSKAAAESLDDDVTATQRERIVRYLCEHGDATRDEMEAALGIEGDAMRPRCRALEAEGWVKPKVSEKRPTRKGREAQVYEPTDRLWRWWRRENREGVAA